LRSKENHLNLEKNKLTKVVKFFEDAGSVKETVGKALFFNISVLRSKLDMAQHNDLVGIIILKVSI